MKILITGSTGFVGRGLITRLLSEGDYDLRVTVRNSGAEIPHAIETVVVPEISGSTNWSDATANVDCIIHLAARAHVMDDTVADPLAAYRRTNVAGTVALAHAAVRAGVKRFVFLSSIKVNGEATLPGKPFTATDPESPQDLYGVSKMEAESQLRKLAKETSLEVVIIRPPLVYGPGVKANFLTMMRWLNRGIPLPLASIRNKRSLVSLDNLVDLIVTCVDHPAAANKTFLVSDGEDLSTTALLSRLGLAMGKPARLIPVPEWLINAGATMVGKQAVAKRLCGSLQVDISHTSAILDWYPPFGVDQSLEKTSQAFHEKKS